jgi:hypothetical protein
MIKFFFDIISNLFPERIYKYVSELNNYLPPDIVNELENEWRKLPKDVRGKHRDELLLSANKKWYERQLQIRAEKWKKFEQKSERFYYPLENRYFISGIERDWYIRQKNMNYET